MLPAHVNLIDEEDGLTPLIVASGRGFSQIVERLIDSDCQVGFYLKKGSIRIKKFLNSQSFSFSMFLL